MGLFIFGYLHFPVIYLVVCLFHCYTMHDTPLPLACARLVPWGPDLYGCLSGMRPVFPDLHLPFLNVRKLNEVWNTLQGSLSP